jgi:hypothetical protein
MSRKSLDKKKKRERQKKEKIKKKLNTGLAILLAYLGSTACIAFVQYLTNFALPAMISFAFQLLYAYVLYYKFKNLDISNISKEI